MLERWSSEDAVGNRKRRQSQDTAKCRHMRRGERNENVKKSRFERQPEEMKMVGKSIAEIKVERPRKKKGSMRSCLMVLSAFNKTVQQSHSFVGSTDLTNDIAQCEEQN